MKKNHYLGFIRQDNNELINSAKIEGQYINDYYKDISLELIINDDGTLLISNVNNDINLKVNQLIDELSIKRYNVNYLYIPDLKFKYDNNIDCYLIIKPSKLINELISVLDIEEQKYDDISINKINDWINILNDIENNNLK